MRQSAPRDPRGPKQTHVTALAGGAKSFPLPLAVSADVNADNSANSQLAETLTVAYYEQRKRKQVR
jgi:hypothetical protein